MRAAAPLIAAAVSLVTLALNPTAGSMVTMAAIAIISYRSDLWISVCAAIWLVVLLSVWFIPGPYDTWAGQAAIPVLAIYVVIFLAAWALGRRIIRPAIAPVRPSETPSGTELRWPKEHRLKALVLGLLAVGIVVALLRFRGTVPPLFSANPDVARELLRYTSNIYLGLLWEAWTLGLCICLFRAISGSAKGRWFYVLMVPMFAFGSALGASKNSVLLGLVTALIAVLSVRHARGRISMKVPALVVLIGIIAVGAAVFLGGQRTLAGTGNFEDEFRSKFGGSALSASVASLDLSLSSSTETFGRLWAQRDSFERGYGSYSLIFSGSPGQRLLGAHSEPELYAITSQLSQPYYMNTATFVAIPLLDFGPFGAAAFIVLLGLCVGLAERRFERSPSPGLQLGRAFVIYFAAFGIYELYPLVQPIWLSLAAGLWCLHRIGQTKRRIGRHAPG